MKHSIRVARETQGLKQYQLAELAQVSCRALQYIESGRTTRRSTRRKVLKALRIPFEHYHDYFEMEHLGPMTKREIQHERSCIDCGKKIQSYFPGRWFLRCEVCAERLWRKTHAR